MNIIGSGIPTALTFKIKPDFKVDTQLALKWTQLSSGKWIASDRGATADVYKTTIKTVGYEKYINDIIQAIYNNRVATSGTPNVLTLSLFSENEKIFGEDVDHSTTIQATVTDFGARKQSALRSFELEIELQAIAPTFIGSAAASITFQNFNESYKGDVEPSINKYDTYNGTFSYLDRRSDSGVFEGTAFLTNAQAIAFRRTLATQRSAPITTTLVGIDNVFGPTKTSTWPKNLVFLEVKYAGYYGLNRQKIQFKAVEDI